MWNSRAEYVVVLSVANLRERDVEKMRHLREMTAGGEIADVTPGFPAVTCPVQANMTTGRAPAEHGVIANGFYWRDRDEVEMWTSPNECIESPQWWDLLYHHEQGIPSAVWFPLHSKECGADYVCTPAPIHLPDGSERMWCFTRPEDLYSHLREQLGDFPLHRFWGPLANIESTRWIFESAVEAARLYRPACFYIYVPHLDYAAQKHGPDSPQADEAVQELDSALGQFRAGIRDVLDIEPLWIVAGEYAITPVRHVLYPNRILREAGLLKVREESDGEYLDTAESEAWALADHQCSHIFVRHGEPDVVRRVVELFEGREGVAEVLAGAGRGRYHIDHPRSGEVVVVSSPDSWQAYYYWLDDRRAPPFARKVDIHRKPGYDPVELFFDPATRSIPLDASLVKGSHGAPARDAAQKTVLVTSQPGLAPEGPLRDRDVFHMVLKAFGMTMPGV